MRILFINLPYHGHVVSTIRRVQELLKQGCEVTYLIPFGWEDKVAESGAVFSGYENHRQLSKQIKNAYAAAEQIIDDFDMVIYEQFFFLGKKFKVKKLTNVPMNVHIYPSVPQVDVLEYADVFVTHGGMNSVSESLVKGTTMVVIPFVSDQPINAGQIEALGLGKKMEYKQITSESLKQTVFSVLHDKEIASNMKKTQELIANAPGNAGGARMIIQYYNSYTK